MIISVESLRTALCAKGMSRQEVNEIKGRKKLVEQAVQMGINLQELMQNQVHEDEDTNDAAYTSDTTDEDIASLNEAVVSKQNTTAKETNAMDKFSDEWNAVVMSKFTDDELFPNPANPSQKLPNINGLRRVGVTMLPDIVFQGPINISTNLVDARPWVSVLYRISYSHYPVGVYSNIQQPQIVEVVAAGDCWSGNAPGNMGTTYATAMAETRAESRAWKKILGLTVPTYEEMSDKVASDIITDGTVDMSDTASDITKSAIDTKCKALGIDTNKFINRRKYLEPEKYKDTPFITLNDITKTVAKTMLGELNNYQNNSELAKSIPPEILMETNQ